MGECLELALIGAIGSNQPISIAAVKFALANKSFDRIQLRIDSTGGSATEALEIYEVLRAQPVPIAATVIGDCLSGALIIYMSASLRSAISSATFLIHPASVSRDHLAEKL